LASYIYYLLQISKGLSELGSLVDFAHRNIAAGGSLSKAVGQGAVVLSNVIHCQWSNIQSNPPAIASDGRFRSGGNRLSILGPNNLWDWVA